MGTRSSAETSETMPNDTTLASRKIRVNHLIGIVVRDFNRIISGGEQRLPSCRRLALACRPILRRRSLGTEQQLAGPRLARGRRLAAGGGCRILRRKHFRAR